jgi:hypothetical protein
LLREGVWGFRENEEEERAAMVEVVEAVLLVEASQCHREPSWEQLKRLLE